RTHAEEFGDIRIAYFSMEYGVTECLPIYSGGLGVLAGDHLKSASDLGIPLVGVGLLYQQGYFHQYLSADGWQQESYPLLDFYNIPVRLERGGDGQPVTVSIDLPGRAVLAQVWRAQVGRVPLYLLDTNMDANRPDDRDITDQLYGGDSDMRIRQEMVLGIGGMRALAVLGIEPTVCHMNEGHSAFLALERIRMAMQKGGKSFAEARELIAAGNVFTTHTPVPAGIDWFPPQLMDHYFSGYYQQLGLNRDQFLGLGRPPGARSDESFSMAIMALRLAASANGVSKLHGQVARKMWSNLWPETPAEEVPITSITNGIHGRSWISTDMRSLLLRYLGPRWIENPEDQSVWQRVDRIPDDELWRTLERRRERLVTVARNRLEQQLLRRGATAQEIAEAREALNPDVLTIGFARRFTTYKRALLLFSDPERLSRLLNDPKRPVQIIFAGKAHPRDNPAKDIIRQVVHLVRREDLRRHVIFLEDYDMSLARYLVQGADVWLNTPRHGNEASGTSGMKAAANGVLHVSTLDGWWHEGYAPQVGWRIGLGEIYEDERYGDQVEAEALYDLLEKEIVPLFYDRGAHDIPRGWTAMMKNAMRELAPYFCTHRMLREYTENLYLPAVTRYGKLAAEEEKGARELASWLAKMHQHWCEMRILSVDTDAQDGLPVRSEIKVGARLRLGALDPQDVSLQAYHGNIGPTGEITEYDASPMMLDRQDDGGTCVYTGTLCCNSSGLRGFTVRVLPQHPLLSDPHVPGLVLWVS
ncbi:MAG: glycosyltransferase family 1 protein, partial [Chloroflexi bacterium]|nr:glycosyltransferase family 1 protein [Chloroflexota bacterium]